jgi:hypothetical protein
VARQVDGDRGTADGQCHGVPRTRALAAVVQEHQFRRTVTPEHPADVTASGNVDPTPADAEPLAGDARIRRCLRDERELIAELGEFFRLEGHVPTLSRPQTACQ